MSSPASLNFAFLAIHDPQLAKAAGDAALLPNGLRAGTQQLLPGRALGAPGLGLLKALANLAPARANSLSSGSNAF